MVGDVWKRDRAPCFVHSAWATGWESTTRSPRRAAHSPCWPPPATPCPKSWKEHKTPATQEPQRIPQNLLGISKLSAGLSAPSSAASSPWPLRQPSGQGRGRGVMASTGTGTQPRRQGSLASGSGRGKARGLDWPRAPQREFSRVIRAGGCESANDA